MVLKGAVIGQRHAATLQIIYTKFLRRGGVQFGINDLRRGGVPLPDDWTLKRCNKRGQDLPTINEPQRLDLEKRLWIVVC